MGLLGAFVLGGGLCAAAEAARRICKGNASPVVAACIVLGVALTAFGLMPALLSVGDAGVIVMVLDCGEALFDSWNQLLAGDAGRMLRFLRDMGVIIGAAALCGVWRGRRRAQD